jgi:P pilus assembly chaperone PapD
MTSVFRRITAVVGCSFLLLASVAVGSGAQASGLAAAGASSSTTTTYRKLPTEFSLTISPTRLVIGQGDIAKKHEILVVNRGQDPLTVQVQKRNFFGAENGTLNFQQAAPYSASAWLTVTPTNFTVAPGQSRTVTATITVPKSPEPGDHQVALVFLVPAGKTSANIKINRGIATPVYITVAGPVNTDAWPTELKAPGFSSGGRVTVTATVRNGGTVHRDFREATPLKLTSSGNSANFPAFTVLRGATRAISTTWNPPVMCICHVKVAITNADGSVHAMSVRVIVFPWQKVLIGLGALLLMVLLIFGLRRRYRSNVVRAAARLNRAHADVDA